MKAHWLIQAVVSAAFLCSTSCAIADTAVDKAFSLLKAQLNERRGFVLDRLLGAGSVLVSANARLEETGRARLYCQPPNLELSVFTYAGIALDEYERRPDYYNKELFSERPDQAIVEALLMGLEETFPCK
jgi:hypothetical protein